MREPSRAHRDDGDGDQRCPSEGEHPESSSPPLGTRRLRQFDRAVRALGADLVQGGAERAPSAQASVRELGRHPFEDP